MDEPRLEELMARLEVLEQEKRRWKGIALGEFAVFILLLILGGLLSVGAAFMLQTRYVHAVRAEQAAREEALRGAYEARSQADRAMRAEEEARRRAEEKKE